MDLKLRSDKDKYVDYIEVEHDEDEALTIDNVIMYAATVVTFDGEGYHYTAYASSIKDLFDDLWEKHGKNTVRIEIDSVFT